MPSPLPAMSSRLRVPGALLLALTLALASCASTLRGLQLDAGEGPDAPQAEASLTVTYTGVGAFLIETDDVAILTDPYWSHYPLRRVAFGHVPPDPAQIDPWVPPLGDVRAVLVGHGHYDHVSDLAYVAPALHPDAVVLASQTVAHTFAASALPRPIVPVNDAMASATEPGRWIPVAEGRARVLPLLSGHPTQYLFFHLWKQTLDAPRDAPPTRARHFQEGVTLGFLVDFFDDEGAIAHRVYIQTSSTGLPAGAVPEGVLAERPVDVALVAMDVANFAREGRRTVLDDLQPPTVIFCHWEDFFRTKEQAPREIVKVELAETRAQLVDSPERRYVFPAWGARYSFAPRAAPDP